MTSCCGPSHEATHEVQISPRSTCPCHNSTTDRGPGSEHTFNPASEPVAPLASREGTQGVEAEIMAVQAELTRILSETARFQEQNNALRQQAALKGAELSDLMLKEDWVRKGTNHTTSDDGKPTNWEEIAQQQEAEAVAEARKVTKTNSNDGSTGSRDKLGDARSMFTLSSSCLFQVVAYLVAFAIAVFVIVYPSMTADSHRRLAGGGSASTGTSDKNAHGVMVAIAYATFGAGMLGMLVYVFSQPLLLGYILGGVLVGPIGLELITDHTEIKTISELGLVLLLFMIGLELDIGELLKMGKVVLLTGFFQFPICAGIHLAIFSALSMAGISWGEGQYSTVYVSFCCGISSTMIVVKLLSEKMETDTKAGRLTIGILIFQDVWAIVMLAIQPNMANPEILGLVKTFGLMTVLIAISFAYSKYVLPTIFLRASRSVELMLILSLAWCFFVCCVAILPFVELSMELAALIAGVAMATFPYNAELNGKVKYIRDYFITLYFVALGMQIPVPTFEAIWKAVVICIVVLAFRWVGIFSLVELLGGGNRLAVLATVNLSEVSEFGLVLCSLGKGFGHIKQDTLTIIIWTFSFLAVNGSYCINYNHRIFHALEHLVAKILHRERKASVDEGDGDEDEEERDIVILGFSRIASALISSFEEKSPSLLKKIVVIDHKQALAEPLHHKGVHFSYGDISSADVLEHAHHGQADLVLITIPDSLLHGITNMRLLEVSRQVWPSSHVIVTADHPSDVEKLYRNGANYVLQYVKLSADRIKDMLVDYYSSGLQGGELKHLLAEHHDQDKKNIMYETTEVLEKKQRSQRMSAKNLANMIMPGNKPDNN